MNTLRKGDTGDAVIGANYGRLTILREIEPLRRKEGTKRIRSRVFICECQCGNTGPFRLDFLKCGHTQSCGCLQKDKTAAARLIHGHNRKGKTTRTYRTWSNMVTRCTNPKGTDYKYYGGRGITVCERWLNSFENFLADMGEAPRGLTLDRIDPNGNYEPKNCRWTTWVEQRRNQRPRTGASK